MRIEQGPEKKDGGCVEKPRRQKITHIVTHLRPHLDELVAMALIKLFGQRKWYWTLENPPVIRFEPSYESALTHCVEEKIALNRVVFIGIGHGEFDEHRIEGRLPNTCSADLVARFLEIDRWPNVRTLLINVRKSDTEAGQEMLSVATVLKTLQAYREVDKDALGLYLNFVQAMVEANLKQGDEFHRVCPKEFEAHGKMVKMGDLRVAFVRTDLESMHKWLRAMRQADIIVQRHSDGHMNIFSGPKGKPFIPEIAFYVGCRENDIMHSRPPNDGDAMSATFATLCKIVREEVDVELTGQAKHWYFHAKAGALHNGSSTHTDKPATTLTLEELEELVRSAVCDAQVRQALLQK